MNFNKNNTFSNNKFSNNKFSDNKFENYSNKDNFNDYSKLKDETINNTLIKKLPYYETYFEHTNDKVHSYEKADICVIFSNVKYVDTKIKDVDIRKVLDFAIKNYLDYAPLNKFNVNGFIEYVNREYNVEILSIGSVQFKRTLSLEQTASNKESNRPNNTQALLQENEYSNLNIQPVEMPYRRGVDMENVVPVKMPYRRGVDMENVIPVEMPHREVNEMPNERPVEMPHNFIPEMPERKIKEISNKKTKKDNQISLEDNGFEM